MSRTPRIIDVSVPLRTGMPCWPDSGGVRLTRVMRLEAGDPANVTRLDGDIHCGTHVEAPLHMLRDGAGLEALPLERFIGPAIVVHLPAAEAVDAWALERAEIPAGTERLLLRTRNSDRRDLDAERFRDDYVGLTLDGARWVVASGIRLVGADYLSVQRFGDDPETHRVLMRAGVAIVEGLRLVDVPPGAYQLVCLPLNLAGAEGAPARAVLIPLSPEGS